MHKGLPPQNRRLSAEWFRHFAPSLSPPFQPLHLSYDISGPLLSGEAHLNCALNKENLVEVRLTSSGKASLVGRWDFEQRTILAKSSLGDGFSNELACPPIFSHWQEDNLASGRCQIWDARADHIRWSSGGEELMLALPKTQSELFHPVLYLLAMQSQRLSEGEVVQAVVLISKNFYTMTMEAVELDPKQRRLRARIGLQPLGAVRDPSRVEKIQKALERLEVFFDPETSLLVSAVIPLPVVGRIRLKLRAV